MFEPAIAGLAAQHASAADVQALRVILTKLAATGERDAMVHAELDIAFHHRLSECTANPILISIHDSLSHLGRAQRRLMASDPDAPERAAFWHEHIVDAIAAGDSTAARDAMRMHLRQVHTDLNASLAEDAASA
ncbi:MAG: FCD domain-containing protein [Actinomycetota bacterium]|nr:FCD domain-containing protein [Actinomycetota bacterium]